MTYIQQNEEEMNEVPVFHLHEFDNDFNYDLDEVIYLYDDEALGIIGFPTLLGHQNLISIETIEKYMGNHQPNKLSITDEYGMTKTEEWGDFLNGDGTIICKEGAFIWDVVGEEFVTVGTLVKTIVSRSVRIDESFSVCLSAEMVLLEKQVELQLMGQFEHTGTDGDDMNMLIVREEDGVSFVIPDDSRFITKGYMELALIKESGKYS